MIKTVVFMPMAAVDYSRTCWTLVDTHSWNSNQSRQWAWLR